MDEGRSVTYTPTAWWEEGGIPGVEWRLRFRVKYLLRVFFHFSLAYFALFQVMQHVLGGRALT